MWSTADPGAASLLHAGSRQGKDRLRSFRTSEQRSGLGIPFPRQARSRRANGHFTPGHRARKGDKDFLAMAGEGRAAKEVLKVAPRSQPVLVAGAIAGVIRTQRRIEIHTIGLPSTRPSKRSLSRAVTWRPPVRSLAGPQTGRPYRCPPGGGQEEPAASVRGANGTLDLGNLGAEQRRRPGRADLLHAGP